jgi:O-antigen ligase
VDFLLFILVNGVLFTRPTEVVPDLQTVPLYELFILACLVVSIPAVLEQLTDRSLDARPISVCVLGLLAAVVLSHLCRLDWAKAAEWGFDFFKVVVYYLLLVAVVNTPARLRWFIAWLVLFSLVLALLALWQYHGDVDLTPAKAIVEKTRDQATGAEVVVKRMRGPGTLFGDPNDLCAVFVVAALFCLYLAGDRRRGFPRFAWLAPLGVFGYAMSLTHSRGGFIGLLAGLAVLCHARYGWKRTVGLGLLALPALLALFAGRMTSLSATEGTGQQRIQVWNVGLMLMREAPVFGIGMNEYDKRVDLVAHNSYIHSYAELGLFGGTLFLGAFYLAFRALRRPAAPAGDEDPELGRLHPFLLAAVAAYSACLLSLSRNYIVTTYTLLGLVTAYQGLLDARLPQPVVRCDGRLARRVASVSVGFLAVAYVFVRLFTRWG